MPVVETAVAGFWVFKAVSTGAHAAKAQSNQLNSSNEEAERRQVRDFLKPSFYTAEFARLAEEEAPSRKD